MLVLGPIGFTAPWLLLGLAALPILWLLLRAVPPAPLRRRFPAVTLLLGLEDAEKQADRTPWWLLLLRLLAVAALILGFAGPVLNPEAREGGQGPLLVLMDGGWADADGWTRRMERAETALRGARREGRPVALTLLAEPEPPAFRAADAALARLPGLAPRPWLPQAQAVGEWAGALEGRFETLWLSDQLDYPWRGDLLAALERRGPVTVFEPGQPPMGLVPPVYEGGAITLAALRPGGPESVVLAEAMGRDPNGVMRVLAEAELRFEAGAGRAETQLSLPPELRNRITEFRLKDRRSAGAVALTDDTLKRREVALIESRSGREGLRLLSPTHYLHQALAPVADIVEGGFDDVLPANPDVIILADVAALPAGVADDIAAWVEKGGLLLRFAGPRLAASDLARAESDPLMPVRLRSGGRQVGGAMTWGAPKKLAPFAEGSPFQGLAVPQDVTVSAQVMAQPDPELAERVIARLADGTPLVTRKRMGAGQVVLYHVTANAEWSSLPLSGLFVEMLERLAVSSRSEPPGAAELEGTLWTAEQLLDGFGRKRDAGERAALPGEALGPALGTEGPGPEVPPGLYAGPERALALNALGPEAALAPARWPSRITVEGPAGNGERPLGGWLLGLAAALLALDILATLALGGRLRRAPAMALLLALMLPAAGAEAQEPAPGGAPGATSSADDARALAATTELRLAHVLTGDAQLDRVAEAGLRGLSRTLFQRTSVEPEAPMGVDLETDELAFFPFLYWPVTDSQPIPSDVAYAKLSEYLRTGGMILFDTRDADLSGFGTATPEGRALRRLAAPLDIPPLEPVPQDHVLTRTFYLLQDFPGRHAGREVWVEAAPPDAEQVEGMPFRNLNDNVTPVIVGGNDWAAAWAVDEAGQTLFPVGRGYAGERQREIAYRFGVNLVMHVLTGNYKSDQVHVPALLDRLGQ